MPKSEFRSRSTAYSHQSIHSQTRIPVVLQEHTVTRASMPKPGNCPCSNVLGKLGFLAETMVSSILECVPTCAPISLRRYLFIARTYTEMFFVLCLEDVLTVAQPRRIAQGHVFTEWHGRNATLLPCISEATVSRGPVDGRCMLSFEPWSHGWWLVS